MKNENDPQLQLLLCLKLYCLSILSDPLLYYFKFLQQKLLNVLPYKEKEEEEE